MCVETEAKMINEVIEGRMTVKNAAAQLNVSRRTIWRKIARYKRGGAASLVHGLIGKKSNRAKPAEVREEVLNQYRQRFGQTAISKFATDLQKTSGIRVSRETVRKWLIDAGMWEGKKKTETKQVSSTEEFENTETIM